MWSIFKRKKTETPAPSEVPTDVHATSSEHAHQTSTSITNASIVTDATDVMPSPPADETPTTALSEVQQTPTGTMPDVEVSLTPQLAATSETPTEVLKQGFFSRLWNQLARTREKLGSGLKNLLTGKIKLDADTRDELETLLLSADVGLDTTDYLLEQLQQRKLKEGEDLHTALGSIMTELLLKAQQRPETIPEGKPRVVLMVGVNGVGKTTTIAKLSHHFLQQKKQLLLAAGDTFRAAAVEQIKTWGDRHNVPVIAQGQDADPASVLYDALSAAQARKVDVMIGDTAGRLHTQGHLMSELKKIHRVMNKLDDTAPHEVWLVIDATTGQNAINQAKEFNAAVGLTGIILTKLDGTAKGGIIFALASQLGLPIRYIGIGEKAEDLRPFNAESFVQALLGQAELDSSH
ncbi:MAG TPA: signal recognition particle-docking protein FtsY [Thiotrichales bacterium]|nr:MAG: signal recognition particle-docking protein FtsY [Thiotrichales bacterium 16-46-22]OZA19552.1 MAG: signal recognition particle-docking protein FtsY [Thiotrichales bacterium 17-46-47]HQT02745.1 signal recognition particle-docking protein FtsY [Thiotrichales bacterium]HQT04723.1 signal recognition particle-docking protein FtsY [Thiotrichales bacterium]